MALARVPLELLAEIGPLGPRGLKGRLPTFLEVELMNQLARVGVKSAAADIVISTGRPTESSEADPIIYRAAEFAYKQARKDLAAAHLYGIYGLDQAQSNRLVSFLERMVRVREEMVPELDQDFAYLFDGDVKYEQTTDGIHKYTTSVDTASIVVLVSRQYDGLFQVSSSSQLGCANSPHYEKKTVVDLEKVDLMDYIENEILFASDASSNACRQFCCIPKSMRSCSG